MARIFGQTLWAALALALGLATSLSGCSAGPLGERLPQNLGGLPAGTPERPAVPYQYPAVHDMPPARATAPLNEEDQYKLEKELRAARDRQEAQEGQQPANGQPKKTAPAAGKKPVAVKKKQPGAPIVIAPAGAKTNP